MRLSAFVATLLCGAALSVPVNAQVAELTLGAILSKLTGDINTIVQEAVGGGLALEVEAGGQISGLIQQAQVAYIADLNLTIDKLSAQEKQTVNDLNSIVQEFTNNAAASAKDVMQRTQQVANSLPLAGLFPQLTSWGPAIVAPQQSTSDDNSFNLTIQGNFVDVFKNNFDAQASIGTKRYTNVVKTTQSISFRIPQDDLRQAEPNKSSQTKVGIDIPYQPTVIVPTAGKQTAHFDISISLLPKAFGSMIMTGNRVQINTRSKALTSPEIQQDSNDDDIKCGGEHGDLAFHRISPDPGWTVIPSSVHPLIDWSQGDEGANKDWWIEQNCSTPLVVCICASTEHHRFGTSGKIHFRIQYTVQQPSTGSASTISQHDIPWYYHTVWNTNGDSSWKITFTRYDGRQLEVTGPYEDPLIKVTTSGSQVTVQSFPLETSFTDFELTRRMKLKPISSKN